MKRRNAHAGPREVEGGDVAEADDGFGGASQKLKVEFVYNSEGTMSAANSDDRVCVLVGESFVYFVESSFVAAGEKATPR